jgi:hypothetical protein
MAITARIEAEVLRHQVADHVDRCGGDDDSDDDERGDREFRRPVERPEPHAKRKPGEGDHHQKLLTEELLSLTHAKASSVQARAELMSEPGVPSGCR